MAHRQRAAASDFASVFRACMNTESMSLPMSSRLSAYFAASNGLWSKTFGSGYGIDTRRLAPFTKGHAASASLQTIKAAKSAWGLDGSE